MKIQDIQNEVVREVVSEQDIDNKLGEIAKLIEKDYEGKDLLLVGVLKGAVMCMADLSRHLSRHLEMDWMAVYLRTRNYLNRGGKNIERFRYRHRKQTCLNC